MNNVSCLGSFLGLILFAFTQSTIAAKAEVLNYNKISTSQSGDRLTETESIDVNRLYPGDRFLQNLDDAQIEIINHFGIQAAEKLTEYIQAVHDALLEQVGESNQPSVPKPKSKISSEEWEKLLNHSRFLRAVSKRSRQIIQAWGLSAFSDLNKIAIDLEDRLIVAVESKKANNEKSPNLQPIGKDITAEDIKELVGEARQLEANGRYQQAAGIWEKLLSWVEENVGDDHPATATSLNNLALSYNKQGLYSKAEPLFQRALAISEQAMGANHQSTATSLNNLALLYQNQGLYSKAEPLYQRALAINEQVLGVDHPSTATSLNNLANLYSKQGLYSKAEPLYQRALTIREQALGADHPSTATSLNNLALLYNNQGLYSKAEPLYQRALTIREQALGVDHPDTAVSLNNLALLYHNQGLYSKAEPLYQRALAISEQALGVDHPDTAMSLNNLALLYNNQGLYSKAEPLYQRALAINEKVLGVDHPDTALSLNNLANLYNQQGLYSKAEPLYQRALAINEKVLGADHPATATSLNNLAFLYMKQGSYSKAEQLLQRALAITEKTIGKDHPSIVTPIDNLAQVYLQQELYNQAESFFQRAIEISEKKLGAYHPITARSIANLAHLYTNQSLYGKAELLTQRALAINEKVLGADHPATALTLNNLALLYYKQGLHSKAEPLFQRAVAINEKALVAENTDMILTLNNLAWTYIAKGSFGKAESLFRRSLSAQILIIQKQAPYLARIDRQRFVESVNMGAENTFSLLGNGLSFDKLLFFQRLNRQGLLEEIEKRQSQLAALPGEQQQVIQELRSLTQQLSSLSIKPEKRHALKKRQEELERQLYRLLPELKPRIVEVEQVAAALPPDGVLIEFQRYQPFDWYADSKGTARYLAMVLKPNVSIEVVDLGEADAIDQSIAKAVDGIEQKWSNRPQLIRQVSRLLIEPVQAATGGATTWFVSPDGELNRLPFAALPSTDGDGYLSDAVELRLLTTGRELLDLQKPAKAFKTDVLLLANPNYGARTKTTLTVARKRSDKEERPKRSADLPDELQWKPLKATAKEGEAIQQMIGGDLLMGEQATAEAVKNKPAPKVLHLATHAFYLPDQEKQEPPSSSELMGKRGGRGAVKTASLQGESPLLRSGIALAGANQPNANPNDDGYLTALEVAQLDWDGTELVVISACESGRGDIRAGEGVYGLKRAIAVAGARSSLLSLWKVNDDATAKFMEIFYKRLKEGKGKAEALEETRKLFRNNPMGGYQEPYYWAAFQLSGDWGPVEGL